MLREPGAERLPVAHVARYQFVAQPCTAGIGLVIDSSRLPFIGREKPLQMPVHLLPRQQSCATLAARRKRLGALHRISFADTSCASRVRCQVES